MPRKATGSLVERNCKYYARVWVSDKERKLIALRGAKDRDYAKWLAETLASMIRSLRDAKLDGHISKTVELVSKATSKERVEEIAKIVEGICSGELVDAHTPSDPTFRYVANLWTSGELARDYPEHVRAIRSMSENIAKLNHYILPIVGDVAVCEFTTAHAQSVMAKLPSSLARATRRHVAQVIHRVLELATWPLEVIKVNPLPRGFLPKLDKARVRGCLTPEEEALVLANKALPLQDRVFVGFLNREGMRKSEAATLEWSEQRSEGSPGWVNLETGIVSLDRNKTNDARSWVLSASVVRALRVWKSLCKSDRFVFPNTEGDGPMYVKHFAETFRAMVKASHINRSELFETTDVRRRINAHDMRAFFITTSLASGKSDEWVRLRTGHQSFDMFKKYRRNIATLGEGSSAEPHLLDEAVPELYATGNKHGSTSGSGQRSGQPSKTRRTLTRTANHKSPKKTEMRRAGVEPARFLGRQNLNQNISKKRQLAARFRRLYIAKHRQDSPNVTNSKPIEGTPKAETSVAMFDALARVIALAVQAGDHSLAHALIDACKGDMR